MKIQAVKKNVVVELTPRDEHSPGGVYIPELSREVTTEGKVLSVGAEVSQVAEGDIVGVPKHLGTVMHIGNKEVVVIPCEKLLYVREVCGVQ
jgi:chaperonin GroES